jgi:3-deoxy-manno-octulosonate cytidylyltransferase (CMP-KDO synthetase)
MYRIVIPARYGSTRLPGKALRLLAGKPMVQWVYERARASGAADILVATDDERIAAAARGFGAEVVLTSARHATGTDRIAEVARLRGWAANDIVVNVQGDEPLLPPVIVDQVARLLVAHPRADIATLAAPLRSPEDFTDPNVVKVVHDLAGRALYFSRAPIPCDRASALSGRVDPPSAALRHIGMYAYRVRALLELAQLPPSRLEELEQLEQLRALSRGFIIQIEQASAMSLADVNTETDLSRAEELLRGEQQP